MIRHTCTCCGRRYTAAEWERLPLCGHWADDSGTVELEMRHCLCGSTRSVIPMVAWLEMYGELLEVEGYQRGADVDHLAIERGAALARLGEMR